MADIEDENVRPSKRARLDEPAIPTETFVAPSTSTESSIPSIPDASKPTTSNGTASNTGENKAEPEVRAGITEYVCPNNLSFSGVFKQRYTDFLVNEILPSGEVLRLNSIGWNNGKEDKQVGNGSYEQAPREKGEVDAKEESKLETGKDEKRPKDKKKTPLLIEEDDAGVGSKPEEKDEDPDAPVISEEDSKKLNTMFGTTAASEIVRLAKAIRRHPTRKAKDFDAVIAPPVADKEARTEAHRGLRRIFPNILESSMEPDQSIRIKAVPPADRKTKGLRRKNEGQGDGRKGRLPWDELGGEYLHFTMYKENKDTMEVTGFLGSMTGGGPRSFGTAGTKDRRACTVQRVSVRRQTPQRMAHIGRQLLNAAIGDFEYQKHEIGLGSLLGNEFCITLRDCHFDKEEGLDHPQRLQLANEVVAKAIADFSEKGFINYYGLQRFGTFAISTDTVGIKLLNGKFEDAVNAILDFSKDALDAANDPGGNPTLRVSQNDRDRAKGLHLWKTKRDGSGALGLIPKKYSAERNIIQHLASRGKGKGQADRSRDFQGALKMIPRGLRLMYVHAYQSLVWNAAAGKRWTTFGDKVVEGDLVLINEHLDKDPAAEAKNQDVIDQDGEIIINPSGDDSATKETDFIERARPLSKAEAESGRYTIYDVVLPQPGFDVEYPRNSIDDFYKDFMGSERGGGLDPYKMRRNWRDISLTGAYRKLLAHPLQPLSFELKEYVQEDECFVETDLQKVRREQAVEADGNGNGDVMVVDKAEAEGAKKIALVLKMQLGSSTYATMALRELMKRGGVKTFQPEFMGGR
ncbi:tRNA pseudouridine synthase D [Polyplosphaeria fusca]|uniref:tRNA pseudouridine synthase D n=1 Tax=Polyplosphaeria fusca TaxID=682080 RepID=A0A9P4QXX8_9PLEO|nr:tRNA pseudouridine synthase D [Polyplosphaeria fusca]